MRFPKDLWDSFTGVAAVQRRQQTSTESIPAVCFSSCNDAALEVQSAGKTPAICASNSAFQKLLKTCETCIAQNGNSTSSDNALSPSFAQYLNYCADENNDSPAASIRSLLSSKSSLAAEASSVDAQIASLNGSSSVASTSASTTVSENATSATQTPNRITVYATGSNTSPPGGGGGGDSPRVSVIVPAVVVPVIVVLVVVVGALLFLRRRRRSKQEQTRHVDGGEEEYKGKPELPADPFRPELEANDTAELSTVKPTESEVAELPAREPVGNEMEAGGRNHLPS
ncbi:hypothetical protein FE257_005602 [Aspergillus nanangensis]|uniref:Uncharacterized protein n=1 Tax=Aspergillus nanangensis TaxID=2582783 RepID=A0AAD4CQF9_ASPNN|nr:hypothetical protein FE257_005602 [Aspergillus nanangensis]